MNDTVRRPAYRVCTERLLMRCWDPADARRLREAIDESDAYLRPWIPFMRDEPRSLAQTAQWLRLQRADFDADRNYRYAILSRDGKRLIGETGLYPRAGPEGREIGYWIRQVDAGRGYATEATAAMVRVAFEVDGMDRVEIHCSTENPASAAVAARLAFRHEATLARRSVDDQGLHHDLMAWTLFAADYPGSPASRMQMEAWDCTGTPLAVPGRLAGVPAPASTA
jgi:RimJ/RimL family protein N-acetyltransferase